LLRSGEFIHISRVDAELKALELLSVNRLFYGIDGKLRSGWRALVFVLTYILVAGVFIAMFAAARGDMASDKPAGLLSLTIPFAIAGIVAVLLGWGYGRWFEGVSLEAMGVTLRHGWLKHLGLGLGLGALAICLAVVAAMATGSMTFALNRASPASSIAYNLATTLIVFLTGAASEETLFRGYPLQTFVRSRVLLPGVVLTSLLFAYAHNLNPSVDILALVNTFIAGIWFAAAYLKTLDLWFPFGIHLAWNWLQGPVFGINVSGIGEFSPDPLMRATDNGPAWLTGGHYGLEGGIACTFALVLSLAVIHFLPIRSNHIET
jgi:membrane protease YdiL (CAAX protease family)